MAMKHSEQKFTREQVERIISLVNHEQQPSSEFTAECIDQVALELAYAQKCKSPCGSCKCGKKE